MVKLYDRLMAKWAMRIDPQQEAESKCITIALCFFCFGVEGLADSSPWKATVFFTFSVVELLEWFALRRKRPRSED